MRLAEKKAVVTGGGQGIGRTIALTLAKEGADIAIYDVNLDTARVVADEIISIGRRALAIKCDVSKREQVSQATKQVLDEFKRIDILVNNAGVEERTPAEDTTEAALNRIIDVDLKGGFFCSQVIGRQMIKQRQGKIINIASSQAHTPYQQRAAYAASKGGIVALTRALAVDWGPYNINVNAISPGRTETALTVEDKQAPEVAKERAARIPLQRINKPQDVANAVLFLASSESDNITGQTIIVDGGSTALHSAYLWPKE